jgi:hypothetical protein
MIIVMTQSSNHGTGPQLGALYTVPHLLFMQVATLTYCIFPLEPKDPVEQLGTFKLKSET